MKRILSTCFVATMLTVVVTAADQAQPSAKLQAAKAKLEEMRQVLKDQHPAMQKQIRLVAALEKGSSAAAAEQSAQLKAAQTKLAQMREVFKDQHPALQKQIQRVEALQAQQKGK